MLVPNRYRRRAATVEAVRITDDNVFAVADWCGGRIAWDNGEPILYVGHSIVAAQVGDYAVRDEFADEIRAYPFKGDAFEASYELACDCGRR